MLQCWQQNPNDRPTFSTLKDTITKMAQNNNVCLIFLFGILSLFSINVSFYFGKSVKELLFMATDLVNFHLSFSAHVCQHEGIRYQFVLKC